MNFLEERIAKDGIVKPGNVLKVDSFLNHQMDIALMDEIGREFKRRFADKKITKILTIEASGIAIAYPVAREFGVIKPEIGYHIGRWWQRRGYATEAALCCRDWVFEHTPFNAVYSYMKSSNAASYGVALKCGMRYIEEYDDPVNVRTRVYGITRTEWTVMQTKKRQAVPETGEV